MKDNYGDNNDKRYPKKGAARKWAARLKELGQKPPLKDLTEKINQHGVRENEKAASPRRHLRGLEAE